MIDEFFNYKKYVFDSPSESPPIEGKTEQIQRDFSSIVLFLNNDLNNEKKTKLFQILKAIKINFDDCTVISDTTPTAHLDNALGSQKVIDIICFGRPEGLNEIPINVATQLNNKTVFVTYSLAELIEEEKNGQVAKRKALWSGLKSWRLK